MVGGKCVCRTFLLYGNSDMTYIFSHMFQIGCLDFEGTFLKQYKAINLSPMCLLILVVYSTAVYCIFKGLYIFKVKENLQ